MPVEAFAVEEQGRLLPDTVRATVADAKMAASHRVKLKGAKWQRLATLYHWRVVPVRVVPIAEDRPRPRPPAPPPRPPSAPRPAALVADPSDRRPIRLARKR